MTRPGIVGATIKFVAKVLLRLLYRVEVKGTIEPADRLLIVSNHQSYLDGVLLGAFLPVWPTYLVHTTVAQRIIFRWPLQFIRHALVDTTKPLAVKAMVQLIESGEPVVIFPEGRITVTGNQMKVYDGPAFVAAKSRCKIIPVHLEGPVYTPLGKMTGDFPQKLFPKIRITIHPPVELPMPVAPRARDRRRLASEELRRILQYSAFASRRKMTIFEALLESIRLHGKERPLLEDINSNFAPATYGTILKGTLALGRLAAKLSKPGEAVGVLMPNANATVYLLLGLSAMRRVPAMLNFTSGLSGLRSACELAQVRTILTSRAFVERVKLEDTLGRLEGVRIVYLEDLRKQFGIVDKLWLILWALRFPARAVAKSQPKDAAAIVFTSGSEGVPKGVVLSHDSILANIAQINAAYSFSSKDSFMSSLPLFHAFGLTAGVLLPLLKGCRIVLYVSPLHYRTVPEFTYDHDCTVLFTTNTFLAKYAASAHHYDFYNVKHLIVGAEKLTEDVRKLCIERFGVRPNEGYGATECSPVIAVNTPLANRAGTVGELLPGIEARFAPVEGIEDAGVLHVKGDNNMLGYLKIDKPGVIQPPESEFGPGWYNTGDVVAVRDHFVTIQARLKRFAKVAGEMVSLEFVESLAARAYPKGEHAAVAIRDAARGDAVVLFTTSPELDREAFRSAAHEAGAPEIASPRRVVYIDKLPLLGNGKRDYVSLNQLAASASAASAPSPAASSGTGGEVRTR